MASFGQMFIASKGQPITYGGKTLILADFFPADGASSFQVVFESCDSDRRQGMAMDLVFRDLDGKWQKGASKGVIGEFEVDGDVYNGEKGIVLWRDLVPDGLRFRLLGEPSFIHIFNVWESSRGTMDSGHNGAAMIVEELPNGRRYRCNDGVPDDDFDDIIFRVERMG
jgi:hypothetical protein